MEWDQTIPVVTFLAGQVAVIGIEWIRHWFSRDQRRGDAREDFQRQTLIDLQEALSQYLRSMRNSIHEFEQVSQGNSIPEWHDLEDPRRISGGLVPRIVVLSQRVDDDRTRELVDNFFRTAEGMFSSDRIGTFMADYEMVRSVLFDANKRIGEVLRAL